MPPNALFPERAAGERLAPPVPWVKLGRSPEFRGPSMIPTALTLALAVLQADPSQPARNPIAPSLPVLTPEQEARIRQTIDRFILADIGVLKGEEAKAATLSFESLGMESVPYLIDGLNKAAGMNQSC